jgi:hypothetical protein
VGDRYWLWMGGRLLLGVAIVAWAASYIGTGSGEKEFQKTLDAMKQVKTFRVGYSAIGYPNPNQHNEMLWEIDCGRQIVHYQMHLAETSKTPPLEVNRDEMHVAGLEYDHKPDGSWSSGQYSRANSATGYCRSLADGTDSSVLPQIATMIKRGVLQKGDKKTVNGVRCREWLVTLRGGPSRLEHDTVCLGLDNHLPYEMTTDWNHAHYSISDYNAPIQFDLPAAALQSTSVNGSN